MSGHIIPIHYDVCVSVSMDDNMRSCRLSFYQQTNTNSHFRWTDAHKQVHFHREDQDIQSAQMVYVLQDIKRAMNMLGIEPIFSFRVPDRSQENSMIASHENEKSLELRDAIVKRYEEVTKR